MIFLIVGSAIIFLLANSTTNKIIGSGISDIKTILTNDNSYKKQIEKFTNPFIDIQNKFHFNISFAQALAVLRIESGTSNLTKLNSEIIGDKNLKNKAFGYLQVRLPALIDVNNYYKTSYKESDLLLEDVNLFAGWGYLNMCLIQADYDIQQSFRKYNGGIGLKENKTNIAADLYSEKAFQYYNYFSELLI